MSHTIAKDEEAAAMAAMFQAQTQNWEETQEKMSQLVLPLRVFIYVVVPSLMNNVCFSACLCYISTARSVSIANRVVLVSTGGPNHTSLANLTSHIMINLCPLVMSVIDAVKKVRHVIMPTDL